MRIISVLALVGLFASTAVATVTVNVYLADEQTPLPLADPNIPDIYRDIMVGTRLTFVVSSETEQFWDGLLWSSWDSWDIGALYGRDYAERVIISTDGDETTVGSYVGSCLEGAGLKPLVQDFDTSDGAGIRMSCQFASPGSKWFVLDYEAKAVGVCYIGLFKQTSDGELPSSGSGEWYPGPEPPPGIATLLRTLELNHVPSRDYDSDNIVNFRDFAVLADQWRQVPEVDPNEVTSSDLNSDDFISTSDLTLFCEYWLERTDVNAPTDDPNDITVGP